MRRHPPLDRTAPSPRPAATARARSLRLGGRFAAVALAATVGVVGAAAGSAAAGSASGGFEHRVEAGETLTSIAQRYGVTIDALVRANHLDDPNQIVVGAEIQVPSSSTGRSSSSSSSTSPSSTASSSSSGSVVLSGAGTAAEAAPFLTLSPWRQALISGELRRAAREFHVSSSLLKALTYTESRWRQDAVSSTGAVGIGQIMPSTAVWLAGLMGEPGLNPYVRLDNIRMSAFLLRFLLDHTGGRTAALAAYYQGLGAVATVGVSDLGARYAQIISSRRLWFS